MICVCPHSTVWLDFLVCRRRDKKSPFLEKQSVCGYQFYNKAYR